MTSEVVCFAFVKASRLIDPRQCARAALCYAGNISAAQCLPTLQCCDGETAERATDESLREEGSRDHPLKVRAGALA